ncbi:50S ribosomal protein L31 [Candidatus Parcubacteria bacterium]|jgi:large subunit ribosomal protein L31|nr:MAG: 50S ribosomal protein L31 [Candidatus Parcubacteria bacterium]
MKKNTHPEYFSDAKVICGCGNVFTTGSTQKEIHVEICSNCHPLFTGKQKVVDTQGRVERFKRIKEKSTGKVTARLTHKKAKAKK